MAETEQLSRLFDAERTARNLHRSLAALGAGELVSLLRTAFADAQKQEPEEAALRYVRIAPLLQGAQGPEAVDLLIDILGIDLPEARLAAGESLEGVAFERFKEVALGVERAFGRLPEDSPALTELPYLLAEVAEPGCVKLLGRFLKAGRAEVVASAIEALVEMGDPTAIPLLEPLAGDARRVELDDEDDDVTIGALATEACDLLHEEEEE